MLYPILICALAGLSTGLGAVFVIINGGITSDKMSFYQGFAGGVMIGVSLFDLLRESFLFYYGYSLLKTARFYIITLFSSGWLIGMATAKFCDTLQIATAEKSKREVYRLSVLTTLIMVMHNLPEGMLTIFTSAHDASFGLGVGCAVALHNIPEGMAIAGPVLYVSGSKKKAFFQSFLAGMAELMGGILSFMFLKTYINHAFINGIMPVIAGIMCQTAMCELIPGAVKLSNIKHTIYGIITGILIMAIGIFAI